MRTLRKPGKQHGYTFLELLIGLGIGAFLLGNGVFMYSALMKSFYDVMAANRLDHQLRSAMNLMVQDIRRAGYSANAINDIQTGANTNPFMAAGTDISVPSSSCILLTYDSDSSGTLPALNAANYDKRFGYRLSGTTLQSRALTDAAFSCTSGTWEDLIESNLVQVTNLTFTLTPTVITLDNGVSKVTIRNVAISLSGRLNKDGSVTRTITENVRVRNDKYTP